MERNRKHGVFAVKEKSTDLLLTINESAKSTDQLIDEALKAIYKQMKVEGIRDRTIQTYEYAFQQMVKFSKIKYTKELNQNVIYDYLGSIEVSPQTKLIRLKSIKALLSRFFNNGFLKERFWSGIKIKIDKEFKKGADISDIEKLLSLIDKSSFIGFRDSVAILTLLKTGIRIKTLGLLEAKHIDYKNKCLLLDGSILKSHNQLKLPIDDQLLDMLRALIDVSSGIKGYYDIEHSFVFITQNGLPISKPNPLIARFQNS
ncbi:tyrosine-type recombinase/integrase [Jeotgalibacillus haloalkalitolerans]|uniref:Site-specific integrase n=1 Tax=Jeotgalibacillus haloalkalitolerans TaxID=3104292 RepID=A0ABU5KR29_9BACL|nr:site-specific integrase [Jeotgalibacillus sp. HH7-29]MDZ5713548.1 site-specific integrase [Jeotgalibacillus sp. HH7-29]